MTIAAILAASPSHAPERKLLPDHRCVTRVVEAVVMKIESCRRSMCFSDQEAAIRRSVSDKAIWRAARKKIAAAGFPRAC